MKKLPVIPRFAVLAFATACGGPTDWPPHQDQLTHLFDQQKDTFVVIEEEMVTDGLSRMGPAIYAEAGRSPAVATLPVGLTDKYTVLFESTDVYLDVTRQAQITTFELLLQNVGPTLYLSRFIHTDTERDIRSCAPDMKRAFCGACAIRLERDWLLEYSWFPADPEVEAREC